MPQGRRRRLTIFSALWSPVEGGAEKQLRQVGAALTELGWTVSVIAGAHPELPSRELTERGLEVWRIPGSLSAPGGLPTGGDLLRRQLKAAPRTHPDVVIGSLISAASRAAILYGRLSRTPTVLRLGGAGLPELAQTRMGRIQAKLLIRGSDMIVINAPHLASGVSITSPKLLGRVVVIPNGVDTDGQLSPDGKETERQPGPARVVYYTNGGPAKNEADFLRIVRASPATLFRAVGNTSGLQGNLNLELRGWREPIASELRWADVVLNTSLSEGSPNFCLQGLALGRSVIGFDNGGILDLARQWPEFVTVVPFGDTEAAVHAIHCSQLDGQRGRAAVPSVASVSREWDVRLSGLVENRYLGFGRAAMRNP